MKKNCFKKILFALILSVSVIGLSGCSSFFATNQGYSIDKITSSIDENGNTNLVITFTDKKITPVNVTIPKGVGIDHVDSEINNDNTMMTITIFYSDETINPTYLNIPIVKGEQGTSIDNVSCELNENGDYNLIFKMSDGEEFGPFPIHNGTDGKEIEKIESSTNEETGFTLITVTFDDGSTENFEIELGKDGRGIDKITTSEIGNEYILNIIFTDGDQTSVRFQKPQATKWYYDKGIPEPLEGNIGDFYIDQNTRTFYTKTSTGWIKIFSLEEQLEPEKYTVNFDINGGEWSWIETGIPNEDVRSYTLSSGSLIDLDNVELQVKRDGYVFNGWWTDAVINPNSGHFTKLTPVVSDITLYANWVVE